MRVKPVASLSILLLYGAVRADQAQELLERARALESALSSWNQRVAQGEAAAVLLEIDDAAFSEEESRDARLANLRGVCLLQLGELGEAVAAFEQSIRADPSRVEAHRNLAVALHGLGQQGRAMSEFGQALELDPFDLEARIGLAEAQCGMRRFADARETLAGLRPTQESDPRVLWLAARVADGLGDTQGSLDAWRRLEEGERSADSARRLAELDRPELREDWLRLCVERDPAAGDCRAALAQLLLESSQPAEAARQLETLARSSSRLAPQNLHNLLLAYQALEDRNAVEALLLDQEPELAASWGLVALVRRDAGDGAAALEAIRRGRALDPDDLDLANLEAVLLAEGGNRAAARKLWGWILERDPGHPDALRNAGG